jgi:MFS family permease
MGAGLSQNIWTLCILRFFAGLAFSPSLAIGGGSIADVNKPEHRAAASAMYILSPFLGPALGYAFFSTFHPHSTYFIPNLSPTLK